MQSLSSFGLLGATGSSFCDVPVAMWSPGTVDMGAWLDVCDGCVMNVDWSMYTALPVSSEPKVQAGYCYVPLLDTAVMGTSVSLFGAYPTLASLLNAPLDVFNLERLAARVELGRRRVLHVVNHGSHEFGRLAVTAMSREFFVVEPGSLAEYLLNVYAAIPKLTLDTGWRVGASDADVSALARRLAELSGIDATSIDRGDASLVSLTAAFMSAEQKLRYRGLEAVGDSVLSLMLSLRTLARGLPVQVYQDARTALSSNVYVAGVAERVHLLDLVQFLPNVSKLGKVGADAFESMIALVYAAGGMGAVVRMCEAVGLFPAGSPLA